MHPIESFNSDTNDEMASTVGWGAAENTNTSLVQWINMVVFMMVTVFKIYWTSLILFLLSDLQAMEYVKRGEDAETNGMDEAQSNHEVPEKCDELSHLNTGWGVIYLSFVIIA